jgi:putative ABC transport system ATP-binding protein
MTLPLSIEGLRVDNDRGRVLLAVDTLDAPPGSLIGVRGPSGAGKSTLLFAVAGLAEHASGCVRWGETDLLAIPPEERAAFRAARMGMIFQDFLLFEELDALGNAALAAMFRPRAHRGSIVDRARDHLTRLGLGGEVAERPRTVTSFSGGERQRVAVARALANDAGILLADEPTASLHREAADALIEDLVALTRDRGRTMIAVSHDLHLLDRMDRVLTVTDGGIADLREAA